MLTKSKGFVVSTVLFFGYLLSPAQEPRWLKHYANGSRIEGLALSYDGGHHLYGAAVFNGSELDLDGNIATGTPNSEILLVKWDTSGTVQWTRTMGGTCPYGPESASILRYDPIADRVILKGQFDCPNTTFGEHVLIGSNNGGRDTYIASFNTSGVCQWAQGVSLYNGGLGGLLMDAESNVFAFGNERVATVRFHTEPPVYLPRGGFIAKYSVEGLLISAERIIENGGTGNADWVDPTTWLFTGFVQPNAIVLGQQISVQSTVEDGFVAQADTAGTLHWITLFPSTGQSRISSVQDLESGHIAVRGSFYGDLIIQHDTLEGSSTFATQFVTLLDQEGDIVWTRTVPNPTGYNGIRDIGVADNGDLLLLGYHDQPLDLGGTIVPPYASVSHFLARIDISGTWKGGWSFGRAGILSGWIEPTTHGVYVSVPFDSTLVLGSQVVESSNQDLFSPDVILARFDSVSIVTGTGPMKFAVDQPLKIFANPNNGRCSVEIPSSIVPGSQLRISVHNNLGATIHESTVVWQQGTLGIDISAEAKGTYQLELNDGVRRYSGTIVFE